MLITLAILLKTLKPAYFPTFSESMVRISHILSVCLSLTASVKGFFDPDAAFLNASEHGCIEGMKEALGRGAHMQTRNNFATTPLIFAANNGHLPAVRYLLDLDAEIEAFSNNGRTPLMWACYWGHIDVVKYLISRGANIDATDFGKQNNSFILLQNKQFLFQYYALDIV